MHWSSTENASNNEQSWTLSFTAGDNVVNTKTNTSPTVRCVSGATKDLSTSFTDNGNGTATDNKTGLIWQRAQGGSLSNFETAVAYCNNLELGGRTDWRLPNINYHQCTNNDRSVGDMV